MRWGHPSCNGGGKDGGWICWRVFWSRQLWRRGHEYLAWSLDGEVWQRLQMVRMLWYWQSSSYLHFSGLFQAHQQFFFFWNFSRLGCICSFPPLNIYACNSMQLTIDQSTTCNNNIYTCMHALAQFNSSWNVHSVYVTHHRLISKFHLHQTAYLLF